MTSDPTILEAAKNALPSFWHPDDKLGAALSIVVAVTPLIRAQVLEEAAKVVEDEDGACSGWPSSLCSTAELAAAIRALAKPSQGGEK
jgi:hypothetical protein